MALGKGFATPLQYSLSIFPTAKSVDLSIGWLSFAGSLVPVNAYVFRLPADGPDIGLSVGVEVSHGQILDGHAGHPAFVPKLNYSIKNFTRLSDS